MWETSIKKSGKVYQDQESFLNNSLGRGRGADTEEAGTKGGTQLKGI